MINIYCNITVFSLKIQNYFQIPLICATFVKKAEIDNTIGTEIHFAKC